MRERVCSLCMTAGGNACVYLLCSFSLNLRKVNSPFFSTRTRSVFAPRRCCWIHTPCGMSSACCTLYGQLHHHLILSLLHSRMSRRSSFLFLSWNEVSVDPLLPSFPHSSTVWISFQKVLPRPQNPLPKHTCWWPCSGDNAFAAHLQYSPLLPLPRRWIQPPSCVPCGLQQPPLLPPWGKTPFSKGGTGPPISWQLPWRILSSCC